MKYVITFKPRYGGSAAENEAAVTRVLEVYSKWTPPSDQTIHQFVLRIDGQGGFIIAETDNPASVALNTAGKFSPFFEYTIYPVLDAADGVSLIAEGAEWRKSIT